ncbi:MAG: LPS assembly protein LptD [Helicobacteraceae bacterium]|nr:LPS assembly protein LptD [Helicobacteraceae bacterium]
MYRKLLLLFITSVLLAEKESVELFSNSVDVNGSVVKATDDVVLLKQNELLQADRIIYDRNSSEVELFGNVLAIENDKFKFVSEYTKMNIKKDTQFFEPFFMLSLNENLWVSSKEASSCQGNFDLKSGITSGCDPEDPLWKIEFSSADYSKENKWLNMYNTRLHFKEVPILYLPYLGFPLDDRRHSGLLMPSLGFSSDEGIYYEQPIYIASEDNWDLELRPQVRTMRGAGLYSKLRFVDSKNSFGEVKFGYFDEKKEYMDKYSLANESDYGFGIHYENSDFLSSWLGLKTSGQSGLYTDINWMNNVEYINLSTNDTLKSATTSQVESVVNMFYTEKKDYIGAYFKYFRDLNIQDNDTTLQKLPTLQYHHYLETFLNNHLLTNVDMDIDNLYRPQGKRALQSQINIPLTLQSSVFDDYLDLSYKVELHGRQITFGGNRQPDETKDENYNSGTYARYTNILSAGTHLSRSFEKVSHTMSLNAEYLKAGESYDSGFYKDNRVECKDFSTLDECTSFYNISDINDATQLKFSQYIFDKKGNELLYHRLVQRVAYNPLEERLGELENEIRYNINSSFSFYNDTFYNHQREIITKTVNSLSYKNDSFDFTLNHSYSNTLNNSVEQYSSYLTTALNYQYDKHYRYFGDYQYDFENQIKKNSTIGMMYTKKCWDFGVRLVENNRPILTTAGSSSIRDHYIYFTFALKPFGGSEILHKISDG